VLLVHAPHMKQHVTSVLKAWSWPLTSI